MKKISLLLFRTTTALCVFLLSVAFYFSPVSLPFKVCIPVGILALTSLFSLPFTFFLAMAFSALGDYFGALHNFPAQMGTFAAGHLAFIFYFMQLGRRRSDRNSSLPQHAVIPAILLYVMASIFILPHVDNTLLRMGAAIYAFLILSMMSCALSTNKMFFWIGAVLFVLSDTALAWNKFVSPLPAASLLIMITYYLGQLLLFCGAVMKNKP